MTTHINVATHVVDLADGRTVPPGATCTPSDAAHDMQLIDNGDLVALPAEAKTKKGDNQ